MEARNGGFGLPELMLIVAVLAAISVAVIPPLTQVSTEENIVNAVSILHHVCSQVDLYKAEHKGKPPFEIRGWHLNPMAGDFHADDSISHS
jgi:general secretion pathway protein G